jgi:hypothetical protein
VPVWYSPTQIRGSQQWLDEIGKGLRQCDWFLIILSPHAVKSIWVKRELEFALRIKQFNNRIVPIKYRNCNYGRLSWVIDSFQIVDFSRQLAPGFRELFRIWDLEYRGN